MNYIVIEPIGFDEYRAYGPFRTEKLAKDYARGLEDAVVVPLLSAERTGFRRRRG